MSGNVIVVSSQHFRLLHLFGGDIQSVSLLVIDFLLEFLFNVPKLSFFFTEGVCEFATGHLLVFWGARESDRLEILKNEDSEGGMIQGGLIGEFLSKSLEIVLSNSILFKQYSQYIILLFVKANICLKDCQSHHMQ